MKRGKAHQEALDALWEMWLRFALYNPEELGERRWFTGGCSALEEAAPVLVRAELLAPERGGFVARESVANRGAIDRPHGVA